MELSLQNKIIVISGCNGGIGEALCLEFLKENSKVAGLYRGDLSKLDHLFNSMKDQNIQSENFLPVNMDINSTDSINAGLKIVTEKWEKVDVLVNNAGWTIEKPFMAIEDDELDLIYASNFSSLAKLSRAVLKIMLAKKSGNIINISSTVADHYGRGVAVYAAMKAAVNRLTEVMALEMGKKNIRVNAICPGVVETNMSNGLQERHAEFLKEQTPLRRYATPEEVAKCALFLASDKTASFITGHKLFIDGGIGL